VLFRMCDAAVRSVKRAALAYNPAVANDKVRNRDARRARVCVIACA
jgi:hypothetical protein